MQHLIYVKRLASRATNRAGSGPIRRASIAARYRCLSQPNPVAQVKREAGDLRLLQASSPALPPQR